MNIAQLFRRIGFLYGKFLNIFTPPHWDYIWILLEQGFSTARKSNMFKCFGSDSYLSPHMFVKGAQYIRVGHNTFFSKHVVIECNKVLNYDPELVIGNNCNFGEFSHITCISKVGIGNNLLTGRFVLITDNSHGNSSSNELETPPIERKVFSKGDVVIGDNVWIGDQVIILPNVTIGNGVIIAANSVVTKSIPDYVIVAGNPAKIVKNINN